MTRTSSAGYNPQNTGAGATAPVTWMLSRRVGQSKSAKVTVTSAKVTVTAAASGKILWQAGMSSLISDVRSYVPLQVTELGESHQLPNEKSGQSEKHTWQAGMYKQMNSLAGYVDRGGREN